MPSLVACVSVCGTRVRMPALQALAPEVCYVALPSLPFSARSVNAEAGNPLLNIIDLQFPLQSMGNKRRRDGDTERNREKSQV